MVHVFNDIFFGGNSCKFSHFSLIFHDRNLVGDVNPSTILGFSLRKVLLGMYQVSLNMYNLHTITVLHGNSKAIIYLFNDS